MNDPPLFSAEFVPKGGGVLIRKSRVSSGELVLRQGDGLRRLEGRNLGSRNSSFSSFLRFLGFLC